MKICSNCNEKKNFTEFHRKRDGYNTLCKICRKNYIKEHYDKNKEQYKERSKNWKAKNTNRVISTRYRQEIGIVERVMSVGFCEICGTTESLVFDHIHKTNQARGCLCHNCNTMLGRLGDTNEEILSKIDSVLKYIAGMKADGMPQRSHKPLT